jgi:hypothetical protein
VYPSSRGRVSPRRWAVADCTSPWATHRLVPSPSVLFGGIGDAIGDGKGRAGGSRGSGPARKRVAAFSCLGGRRWPPDAVRREAAAGQQGCGRAQSSASDCCRAGRQWPARGEPQGPAPRRADELAGQPQHSPTRDPAAESGILSRGNMGWRARARLGDAALRSTNSHITHRRPGASKPLATYTGFTQSVGGCCRGTPPGSVACRMTSSRETAMSRRFGPNSSESVLLSGTGPAGDQVLVKVGVAGSNPVVRSDEVPA